VSAPGIESRLAIEIDGKVEPSSRFPSETVRRGDGIAHFRVRKRHEGNDVRRPDPRVGALVRAEVDPRKGRLCGGERRPNDVVRLSQEGEDASVVVGVAVHVRESDIPHRLDGRSDGAHRLGVSPFAEVGNAFQNFHSPHTW